MEDSESSSSSSSSRPVDSLPRSWKRRQKADVYQEILHRLRNLNEEVTRNAEFETKLWLHFSKLPVRYAVDVNVDSALDVLMHQRLLSMARDPATRPAIEVRLVLVQSTCDGNYDESVHSDSIRRNARCSDRPTKKSKYPLPAFSSAAGCEIGFDIKCLHVQDQETTFPRSMHEITISTVDKPKLLSQLTTLISELGLNIQEAHAFSTVDGYSLDVFVVDGWALEGTKQLKDLLIKEISKAYSLLKHPLSSHLENHVEAGVEFNSTYVNIPIDEADVWEIDVNLLTFEQKIASGSCSDLYKGYYCGQDVAIKLPRVENLYEIAVKEFIQEVNIMRKMRHKNVVQFIGACTRSPSLCIITEYMSGGSMYDFLRRHKGVLTFSSLVRVALEVSKGMNYLHQNNIMHRDLKAANLLVDEDGVVKLADFGVARVQVQSGVMTAETGTYRWMAPEIIEHKPYDHKADVFSFGIVLWELLTCKLPYQELTPLQAAVGVVQKGLRPIIPEGTHPMMVNLMEKCWQQDPSLRPEFFEITELLLHLSKMMKIVLMAVVLKITSIQGGHNPARIQSLVKLCQETEGFSKIKIEVPAKEAQYSPENLTSVPRNTEISDERQGAADLQEPGAELPRADPMLCLLVQYLLFFTQAFYVSLIAFANSR